MKTSAPAPLYIESSAFVKLFLREPESAAVNRFVAGRRDLMISELCLTELASALARHVREGRIASGEAARVYGEVLKVIDGPARRINLTAGMHRTAERLLMMSTDLPLRTLDALHIASAMEGNANSVLTFDHRVATAARNAGFVVVDATPRSDHRLA